MPEEQEIRGVIPNYYSLIIDKLNKIYEAWDHNDSITALDRALKLIPFLPNKLKNEIKDDEKRILRRIQNEARAEGYFYNSVSRDARNHLFQIANQEIRPFIEKITTLLDNSHLLTQGYGLATKARSMGDLQKTVDKARYDQEHQ